MAGRFLVVGAGLALLLAGCVTNDGVYNSSPPYGYGSPYERSRARSYDDEPRRMSGRAMAALAEGCKQRFYPGTSKFKQCIRGERKSDDSLVEGCTRLYKNDRKNYGRCLQGR